MNKFVNSLLAIDHISFTSASLIMPGTFVLTFLFFALKIISTTLCNWVGDCVVQKALIHKLSVLESMIKLEQAKLLRKIHYCYLNS